MQIRFLVPITLLGFLPGAFAQTTVFSDTFPGTTRTGWFSSAGSSSLTVVDNALVQATGSSGRSVLTYFPETSLSVGDTLTLSYSLKINGPAGSAFSNTQGSNNQLRVGLFSSGGSTKVNADNFGSSSYPGGQQYNFASQDGYAAVMSLVKESTNSDGSPAGWTIRSRTGTNTALISTTSGYTTVGSTEFPTASFAADTTYNISFGISRTDTGVDITATISGGEFLTGTTLIRSDNSGSAVTTFDMLSFHLNSNVGTSFTVDNVSVTYTAAAIPEPGTYALWAGASILAIALLRRRLVA